MQVCCPFIAAILLMPLVSPVDGFTVDYPEKCRNCRTGVYCFSISRLPKNDSLLNVQGQWMNGSAKKKVQTAHFILKIQVERMHASFKRFVQEINALLGKEGEITVYSLDIQGKHIGGFSNEVDQEDNLIINVQGKGTDAAVRELVQEIKDMLKRQCQIIKSSLYREGQETHAYISRLGQVRNAFLRKKRTLGDISLNLGVGVSLNKLIQGGKPSLNKQHQGNKHRGDHFILNVHAKGTNRSLRRLVHEIEAFLETEDKISDSSIKMEHWEIDGDQKVLFILHIQGRGTGFSIERLIQVINGFLTRSRQLTDIFLSIQGPGLDTSLSQLITELNASLNMQDQGTDVLNKNEHTGIRFILSIHVRGTDASVNKLTQEITKFLKREDQITDSSQNMKQQEIPGSPNSADQRALFAVHIQGLGTDYSIKRLVQVVNKLLTRNSHLTDVSLNIQGQGIGASIQKIIQEFNASLNNRPHADVPTPSNGDKRVKFTFNIQGQGDDASQKRFVEKIKAYLGKEGQIMDYSVSMEGKSQGNQVNLFTVTIQGQGTDDSLRGLVENINAILQREGKIKHINLNIEGQGIGASLHQFILEINASLNKSPKKIDVPKDFPFMVSLQGQATVPTLNRLQQEFNIFLKKEQITDSSVNLHHQVIGGSANNGGKTALFILVLQGQGTAASLSRLVQVVKAFLKRERQIMASSLRIEGQQIDSSLNRLIKEYNAFLEIQYEANDILYEKGAQKGFFMVSIHGQGTDASVTKLEQAINAFLKRESQISDFSLNIQRQRVDSSSNNKDQWLLFIVSIQGQGMYAALNKLVEEIDNFLESEGQITDYFLKIDNQNIGELSKVECIDDIQRKCQYRKGACYVEPCRGNMKEIGSCGPRFYCCK